MARGFSSVRFLAAQHRPQSLHGNWLSILGLLDSPVNVVLNSNPGPGLEKLFVGLGPSGAWLALCAQNAVVRLGPSSASSEVLLVRRTAEQELRAPTERARTPGGGRLCRHGPAPRSAGQR